MYIEVFKNNGTQYLRLVSSHRVTDKNGRRVARKKTELNIGPLSRYDDGKPDYLKRLKESFKKGHPIIDKLLPFVTTVEAPKTYSLVFTDGSPDCISHPKIFSQVLLDRVFHMLGLDALCATLKHNLELDYDLAGFLRLMVFGRVLQPASKLATTLQNDFYYTPLVKTVEPHHIYDALDVLYDHRSQFIQRMNSSIKKTIGRSPKHIYYDVTNFFFETEVPDEDIMFDSETVPGLRKPGVSKENRRSPIVQMGLFLDDNGIPITIEAFPGNTLDHQTLLPALDHNLMPLDFERYVLVADRGMCMGPNLVALQEAGHGYIISRGIAKSDKKTKQWILDPEGYHVLSENFKYKEEIRERIVTNRDKAKQVIREKVVVYWSRNFYSREYAQHKKFLDFIKKLRENPASFRVTAIQVRNLKKFFKKEFVHKDTGEVIDSKKLIPFLDEDKLEAFTAYMGYYQIVTSEVDMDALEVIDKYHELTRIEDQFRVMKGTLETRPMFVRTPEHIKAHLLTCLMALTVIRVIQKGITDSGYLASSVAETAQESTKKQRYWSYGISSEKLQTALLNWKIEKLPDDYYRFCDSDDETIQLLCKAFHIEIKPRLYTRGDLKKMKAGIQLPSVVP